MDQPSNPHQPTPGSPRPVEQAAVLTTIVGSRPPGSGQPVGRVPRGIEVLVKKAAVDAEFKELLLEKRDEAAGEIALELAPAEILMLRAVPAQQLEGIIARTTVPEEHRRAFLGKAAAAMLAALGVTLPGCGPTPVPTKGIAPDRPKPKPDQGNRPDRPPMPSRDELPKGHDAKRPPQKEPPPKSEGQDKQGSEKDR